MMKKVRNKIIFAIFLLSAAAMDSSNIILPGTVCLIAVCSLYIGCGTKICKKKEPVAAGSIKKLADYIIAQGKEKVNGKMQSMRRKLR